MNAFFKSLSHLGNRLPEVILVITLLAVLVILILTFLATYAVKKAEQKGPSPEKKAKPHKEKPIPEYRMPPFGGRLSQFLTLRGAFRVGDISLSFLRALAFLRGRLDTLTYKYQLPWYLMVGASNSGKSTLLESAGMSLPVGMPDFGIKHRHPACRWWFYNRAVVLDIHGSLVIEEHKASSDEHGWRTILSLLGRYRSKRPLDGIILTISAAELYGRERLSPENLNARAKFLAHKLTTAQHLLGLRLPVYVIVTKCDFIPGFQSFCHELPLEQHFNMLGWSVPYALHTAYAPHWVDEAFHSLSEDLSAIQLEMFAHGIAEENGDGILVLSNEFATLKNGLQLYLDHIFKSSAYEESLMLRGIYFCGDGGNTPAGITVMEDLENENEDNETKADLALSTQPRDANEEALRLWNENMGTPNRLSQLSPAQLFTTDESQYLDMDTTRRSIFFGKDIFEDKIFFESGLAYPVYSRLVSANRNINLAKAGMVAFVGIGTFGMFNAYENFMKSRDFLIPVLGKVNAVLQQSPTSQTGDMRTPESLFNAQARSLLDMMHHLQRTSFFSFFIPSSWFSPLRDQLHNSLKISYEQIILRTIYMDLLLKARDTLNIRPGDAIFGGPSRTTSLITLLAPLTTREFHHLNHYVDQISQLLENIDKYNHLRESPDPNVLSELIAYTFHIQLPPEFSASYDKFRKILQEAPYPPIDLKAYYPMAQNTLEGLYTDFLNILFSPYDPMSLIGQLRYLTSTIGGGPINQPINLDVVRGFITGLGEGLPGLGEAGHNWIDGDYFDPGPRFSDLIAKLDRLPPFGPAFVERLARLTSNIYKSFHNELLEMNRILINPAARTKPPLPSEGLFNLEKNLQKLFAEPFMAKTNGAMFTSQVPENKFVLWNQRLIEDTINLIKRYETFVSKELDTFPLQLREAFKQIALQNLQLNVISDIANAQSFIDIPNNPQVGDINEELLRNAIGGMKATVPSFIKLLETLNQMHNTTVFAELQNLLGVLSMRLLERIDALLLSYRPYTVRDNNFDWWDGKTFVFLEGFAVRDPEELKSYLDQQRQLISHLAIEYAQPIITLLGSNMMQTFMVKKALVNRWSRIIDQLSRYDKRKPDNTISSLENFIDKDANTLTMNNCFEKFTLASIRKNSGDFFTDRRLQLQRALMARCEIAKRQDSVRNYEKLVAAFNEFFKDKFPFVAGNPSENQVEVEPEDIKSFFRLYHECGDSPKNILEQVYQLGDAAREPYEFLKAMEEVKSFFHTYLNSKEPGDAPTFDFTFDFRVNQDKEVGGNMIIEWTIAPDDHTTISNTDKKREGRWRYGNPVTLTLRWPDSAETQPFLDNGQPFMSVDEQTVTYTYPGQWSLLWLIRLQQAPSSDFGNLADPTPYTLRFEIPNGPDEKTVVYDRIVLHKPAKGKKPPTILRIPDFQTDAPGLNPTIMDVADKPVITQGLVETTPEIAQDIAEREQKAAKKAAKKQKKSEDEGESTPDQGNDQ